MVRTLADNGAKVIARDIILSEPEVSGERDSDGQLARALRDSGRAVLPIVFDIKPGIPDAAPEPSGVPLKSALTLLTKLGPKLNGIVNYDFWVPEPTLKFPGIDEFLQKYQARAEKEGVDPLGYYLPPWAYAYLQVLGNAIEATKSLDQQKVAEHIRSHEHDTIVGKVKFGPNGEWATSRVLQVQFQGIEGTDLAQFKKPGKRVILYPDRFKSGNLIYPYAKAKS